MPCWVRFERSACGTSTCRLRPSAYGGRSATRRAGDFRVQTIALLLRRMRTYGIEVYLGSPAGTRRQHELAVLERVGVGQEVAAPGDFIDVDLHDAEVRN